MEGEDTRVLVYRAFWAQESYHQLSKRRLDVVLANAEIHLNYTTHVRERAPRVKRYLYKPLHPLNSSLSLYHLLLVAFSEMHTRTNVTSSLLCALSKTSYRTG
jgi:hypothetical protein